MRGSRSSGGRPTARIPYVRNAREFCPEQRRPPRRRPRSRSNGFRQPSAVYADGVIIGAGHTRLLAAQRLQQLAGDGVRTARW